MPGQVQYDCNVVGFAYLWQERASASHPYTNISCTLPLLLHSEEYQSHIMMARNCHAVTDQSLDSCFDKLF